MIIELVKYPVLTEKSVRLMDRNQYTFDVDLKLTKPQIRTLIEELLRWKLLVLIRTDHQKRNDEWVIHKGTRPLTRELLLVSNAVNLFRFCLLRSRSTLRFRKLTPV